MNLKQTSKRLSYVLRHRPDSVGLTLDEAGWVPVEDLLKAMRLSRSQLEEVVATNDKQRFVISPDGDRIRANQGHSVEVDLQLDPAAPPDTLYHGTVARNLDSIRKDGLIRGSRHHVHLSADPETATKVGARRGKPVILEVDSKAMAAAGHVFYRSANGVWLTGSVPPSFLVLPGTGEASSSR